MNYALGHHSLQHKLSYNIDRLITEAGEKAIDILERIYLFWKKILGMFGIAIVFPVVYIFGYIAMRIINSTLKGRITKFIKHYNGDKDKVHGIMLFRYIDKALNQIDLHTLPKVSKVPYHFRPLYNQVAKHIELLKSLKLQLSDLIYSHEHTLEWTKEMIDEVKSYSVGWEELDGPEYDIYDLEN